MATFDLTLALTQGRFTVDVSIQCEANTLALCGPSGSGKSSVLEAVAGIRRPTRGRIAVGSRVLFDGASEVDVPARERRVGYVPQDALLFPHLTVRGNIAYGAPQGIPPDIEEAARQLDVHALMSRSVGALSGGERQRVAFLRALAARPALLLLDEPLSALDVAMGRRLLDVLAGWRAVHHTPLIYVTHARDEVAGFADQAALLLDGRVVAAGDPSRVLMA